MAFSIAKAANWLHQVHRARAVVGWWPEQFALEDFDKKTLREILRILRRPVPTQSNVFVDGPPISGAERLQRAFPLR